MTRQRNTEIPSVAVYCRFSKDEGKAGDSSSIETQKEMLTQYVRNQGWRLYDIYVDDGYSGLNMNRPDFKRMIFDVDEGKVNIIITKDMSRLSRNYLECGMYMEVVFPQKGVRYLALNDNVDTDTQQGMDIAPFKAILNEMYSKDLSRKISSARRTRFNQGKWMGATPPYGYKKSPEDKNLLIINEEHAPTIRMMYEYAKEGKGISKIRQIMTEKKIPRPGVITFANMATFHLHFEDENDPNCFTWSNNSVRGILRNPVYAGHLAGYKRIAPSMKSKKRLSALPEDWLIVPNTHEAIIPPDEWELVQKLITSRRRTGKSGYDNIFAGLIKCGTCGYAMRSSKANRKEQSRAMDNIQYTCNNYCTYGKKACTSHAIEATDVYNAVLGDIRYHAGLAVKQSDKMLDKIISQVTSNTKSEKKALTKELNQSKSRLSEIDSLFLKLYEDRNNEKITERNYTLVSGKYEDEQWKLGRRIEEIEKKLAVDDDAKYNAQRFVNAIQNYKDLIELDAELLNRLIEKVTVSEARLDENGELQQEITIYYKFIGKFDV